MLFQLKAVDSGKQIVAVELESSDETAAREIARQRGYAVLSVERKGIALDLSRRLRQKAFPTTLFSIELLALLDAGLNVVEALQTLAEKEPNGAHRRVLANLLEQLHRGASLSQSLECLPGAFSPLYVATVRSSERTGDLKEAIARYVAYQEELDKVRKKVLSALVYPAILVIAGTGVLAFLILYVVPRFARVYADISADLPFFSSLLLSLGRWIDHNGTLASVALLAIGGAGLYAVARPRVRAALVLWLWRLPVLGERLRVYQLARFYRTVGMLLRAGIPVVRAFELVAGLLDAHLRHQLTHAASLLREGQPISKALTASGLATPVATRMLTVGERSGRIGELMERIARFCDEETARWVDGFLRIFEPALMALIGVAVGGVVALMYMPVFELAGSIR